ncbi:MAG: ribonuclease [Niastella sp.]|nr:ribonuclease [Niastella sp.]
MKLNKGTAFERNKFVIIILLFLLAGLIFYLTKKDKFKNIPATEQVSKSKAGPANENNNTNSPIDELTSEAKVVGYIKFHGVLPPYYITKSAARRRGWNASSGNLCEVAPGKAIGGDIFTNRQALLPVKKGRAWYEADLDYNCGRRNAHRVLFSNDGLIFVTYDHYKTVDKK